MNNLTSNRLPTPNDYQRGIRVAIWLIITAIVFFAAGWQWGEGGISRRREVNAPLITVSNQATPSQVNVDFAPFWQVWDIVTSRYLERDQIDPQKLVWGAIAGMVKAIGDPYTAFLTPEENREVKEELEGVYSGVGIQLGFKDKKLVVIAPLSGTPAEAAGVQAGDFILKIDDKETADLSLPEAVKMIRGAVGTKVKLTFLREGKNEPFDLELTRASIVVKSVEVKIKSTPKGKVAVIKLSRFGEKTNEEWDEAVSQVLSANVKGVVLDVRNNPGGFLNGAVYVASEFLTGKIVGQAGIDGDPQFITAGRKGKLLSMPLVALVNKGSASAAEIVAGALQVRGRAKLVGETTFGKGTIQDTNDLPSGGGVHVTIAKWLLPNGQDINGSGVKPDVEVAVGEQDLQQEQDPQLDKALEILTAKF